MKKFFIFTGLIVAILVAIILFRTYTAEDQQPPLIELVSEVKPIPNAEIRLGDAITYQTISHHSAMMDREAWDGFGAWMRRTYTGVFSTMDVDTVGTHTYILRWKGATSERPVLLMGHQDVVPIDASTEDQWIAPPFSGDIVDGYIYGRGTLDDKGAVVGLLEAAEALIHSGFTPPRDIWFSFGQDEEIRGDEGAVAAANWFYDRGIEFDWVMDEGGLITKGVVPGLDVPVALIGTAEKGYISIDVKASYRGGHSSMPKDTNSITVLMDAIERLRANDFETSLDGPVTGFLEYVGPHSNFTMKMASSNRWLFDGLITSTYQSSSAGAALVKTTWSPTIIRAGIKDNVIPETALITFNSRILPGQTADEVMDHFVSTLDGLPVEISLHDGVGVDPSPISPHDVEAFDYIGSVLRTCFRESDLIVAPYLMVGATDGLYMSKVSEKVYRCYPFVYGPDDLDRLHGLNERISIENYTNGIQFYIQLMANLPK